MATQDVALEAVEDVPVSARELGLVVGAPDEGVGAVEMLFTASANGGNRSWVGLNGLATIRSSVSKLTR
ncbi:MAG: hypothetical protein ACRDJ4_14040 [Actinomycetota bacterium]